MHLKQTFYTQVLFPQFKPFFNTIITLLVKVPSHNPHKQFLFHELDQCQPASLLQNKINI